MIGLLSFATSGIGRVVMIVAALAAWTIYMRVDAAKDARKACQEETLRQTVTEMQRQQAATQAALDAAEKRAQESDAENLKLEREKDAIVEQSTSGKVRSCTLDDATRERLRRIK